MSMDQRIDARAEHCKVPGCTYVHRSTRLNDLRQRVLQAHSKALLERKVRKAMRTRAGWTAWLWLIAIGAMHRLLGPPTHIADHIQQTHPELIDRIVLAT